MSGRGCRVSRWASRSFFCERAQRGLCRAPTPTAHSRVAPPVIVLAAEGPGGAPLGRQGPRRDRVVVRNGEGLHGWEVLDSGDLGVGVRVMRPAGRSQAF